MKKQNWELLQKEFILYYDGFSVKDFLVSKGILEENKRLSGAMQKHTKGWQDMKKDFWLKQYDNYELEEETKIKLAQAVDKSVEAFVDMMNYYILKNKEKIQQGQKGIYIDELLKFGKMLENYHGLKLGTENSQQEININSALTEDDLEILEDIKQLNV